LDPEFGKKKEIVETVSINQLCVGTTSVDSQHVSMHMHLTSNPWDF